MMHTIQFWNKDGKDVLLVMGNELFAQDFVKWARSSRTIDTPIIMNEVSNEAGQAILNGRSEEENEEAGRFMDAWERSPTPAVVTEDGREILPAMEEMTAALWTGAMVPIND